MTSNRGHLDHGAIITLRDEGPSEAWDKSHAEECGTCVADLAEARMRSTLVADALSTLDLPVDLTAAKAATRARLDRARSARSAPEWRRWPLGRAAAVLLATAGAASALTWSPVRSWWTAPEPAAEPAAVQAPPVPAEPPTSSIEVEVAQGRIDVIVTGARPGSVLEVAWGDRATARVVAPRGSRFTYADGRVQVDAAAGTVRAELPRAVAEAAVQVDTRVYVARSAAGLEVLEPATERTDDLIRFVIAGP